MAQFFATLSIEPGIAADWQAKGLKQLEEMTGLRTQHSLVTGGLAFGVLPSLRTPAVEIVTGAGECGPWISGVGSWFFRGATGVKGLRNFRSAMVDCSTDPHSLLQDTEGMFCLVLGHQADKDSCTVCTDRLGTLHVYAAEVPGGVLLSTSSLAIASLLRPEWDPVALRQFFSYGNVFESRTLFRGVQKLPPGSLLRFRSSGLQYCESYWRIVDHCHDKVGQCGGVVELADTLRESVRTIGRNFRKPVLDLTGGFDSRAIFGAMLGTDFRFQTVTNGSDKDSDVETAKKIANEFRVPHIARPRSDVSADELWKLCKSSLALLDGEADVLSYALTLRSHLAQSMDFDVTINGSLGEICKGQWWEALLPHIGRRGHWEEDARTIALKRFAVLEPPASLLAFEYTDTLLDDFAAMIERATVEAKDLPNTALVDTAYLALRMQSWQGRLSSATLRIWPCCSPFASSRALEIALSSPIKKRIRHRMMRQLIEHQSKRLAAIPLAQGYPASPLRLQNLHHFLPLAVEIGNTGWRHVRRQLGWRPKEQSAKSTGLEKLWSLEEVQTLLDPGQMRSAHLYHRPTLETLLEKSPTSSGGGRVDQIVGRILTLELTSRSIGL